MSLLRADKITNQFKNGGPIIVGLTTVDGNLIVNNEITAQNLSVTNSVIVGQGITSKFLDVQDGANLTRTVLTGVTTAGIVNATTFFGDGVNLTGIVTTIVAGTGIRLTPPSGKGQVTIDVTGAETALFADQAGIATDIKGGSAGRVLYQAGLDDTDFTEVGEPLQILQSTGAGKPIWVDPVATQVDFSDEAGIATNIKGGSAGKLLIQTAPDTTEFLPIGPLGNVLITQGTDNPIFVDPLTDLDVRFSTLSDDAGLSTDIKGGQAGQVVVQSGVNETNFTEVGNTGDLLVSQGTDIPIFVNPLDLNVGSAVTSEFTDDINGGDAGQVVVQTGPNQTDFTAPGGTGDLLVSQGTGIPVFTDPLEIRVGSAETSDLATIAGLTTDITGGGAGQVVVQTGPNQTAFTDSGNTGDLLVSEGNDIPVFTDPLEIRVGSAKSADVSIDVIGGVASVTSLEVSGITTLGFTTIGNDGLNVSGLSSLNDITSSGITTLGFTNLSDSVEVTGIASVGAAVTIFGETGEVKATAFFGDGENLTNVRDTLKTTNILYVNVDGDDENDGRTRSTPKRTVGSALTIAQDTTVVKISAGNYIEDNPIVMPEQTTLLGDSLREVSLIPKNADKDLIYVSNGSYVENMSFTGTLNEGKAIISFNPEKPSYVLQGPYIRNCTNFISNSIGMKIDGSAVLGDTRAMNVDSYTQLNQGGIGVSISNEGYAQLVSIFTIYNDQSIVCISGGVCDLTNSNSSFGRLGLVADGLGPLNFTGVLDSAFPVDTDVFTININQPTYQVSNAVYDNTTGLTTITTSSDHGFNVGMSVTISDLRFSCDSADVVREVVPAQEIGFNINSADYTASTGIMTVTTNVNHNFNRRSVVELSSLLFECDSGGGPSQALFPPSSSDNNGPTTSKFIVSEIPATNEFVLDVGVSTIAHTYVSGGIATMRPSIFGITNAEYTETTGVMTVTCDSDHNLTFRSAVVLDSLLFECDSGGGPSQALFPPQPGDNNGPSTSRFSVQEIPEPNVFEVNVGTSTIAHDYISGGTAENTPFYGITTAVYDENVGILTVTTDVNHNFSKNITVKLNNLVFECDSGGGIETAFFPPSPGDNNGAAIDIFDVIKLTPNTFEVNVGPSTIAHGYIEGGRVSISTEALFPSGRFGEIFYVNEIESPTQFNTYVGVSTYPSDYVSGGEVATFITRPYDGQVVYFDELYDTIQSVTITDGGSGYTSPPNVTISSPNFESEPWGITATAVAQIQFGVVTEIDIVSNGRGYAHNDPVTVTIDPPGGGGTQATAVPVRLPTYYVVSESTEIQSGICTVTFTERLPYAVGVGTTVPFFKQSRILASSQAFEYIGSGNTALTALPQRGGIVRPENETISQNGGLVIYTSTDQAGNFKIGDGVIINQLEGRISGDAYERSLFATITPFILALGGD